jgi:putative flippase GtrA
LKSGLKGSASKGKHRALVLKGSASQMQEKRIILGQMIRFGMTGGFLTIAAAAGYWAIADLLHVDPNISFTIVFIIGTIIAYVLHSRWSFKGHEGSGSVAARTSRFLVTNSLGFASNQFFVWLLVKQLGGATWWPVIPIIIVTPILTFTLNRKWVFG